MVASAILLIAANRMFGGTDPSVQVASMAVSPASVHLIGFKAAPGCLSAAQVKAANDRLNAQLAASGAFAQDPASGTLVRARLESSDGACLVSIEYQDDKMRLEGRRVLAPGEGIEKGRRLEQAVDELAEAWFARHSAELSIQTRPAGAQVSLGGKVVGFAPVVVHRAKPGPVAVQVRAAGWSDASDSIVLEAGATVKREYALQASRALKDSLHRDSLLAIATKHPGQALPELFSRLVATEIPSGRHTVAILPFKTESDPKAPNSYDPGTMAAEYGVARFSKDPRFVVVDRQALNHLLQEQALAQSGAVGDSVALRAGQLLAAQYIVVGTVRVQGPRQEFWARLISVETGQVLSAAMATSASDQLESLYRTALSERTDVSSALYRSAVGPGWGQFYTGHPVQGSIALGAFLASAGWTAWCWSDFLDKDATLKKYRQNDPSTVKPGEGGTQWLADAESARSARNDAASRVGLSGIVLGAVWALNVVDAGILGGIESGRIRARYFAWTPSVTPVPDGLQLAWRF